MKLTLTLTLKICLLMRFVKPLTQEHVINDHIDQTRLLMNIIFRGWMYDVKI